MPVPSSGPRNAGSATTEAPLGGSATGASSSTAPRPAPSSRRTDRALLREAIRLFGTHGYEGVSTRMLAAAANANVSSIRYHFGGKDALYVAAMDEIIETLAPRVALIESLAAHGVALAAGDPDRLAALVRQVTRAALDVFLGSTDARDFLPFVLRELGAPGPHFDRLYHAVPMRLHTVVTRLVAHALGRPEDDPATIVRAHAVIGQIIVFHVGRPILARRLGGHEYTPEHHERIVEEAATSILASLGLADARHGGTRTGADAPPRPVAAAGPDRFAAPGSGHARPARTPPGEHGDG